MEITFRFGADKRKAKQIVEQQRMIDDLNKEIRDLKISKDILEVEIIKKDKSIKYYKKKLSTYETQKKQKTEEQRND